MELRNYQSEAISSWSKAQHLGIWEMATGTGKTFTAVSAILNLLGQLQKERESCLTLVVCPLLDLVDQWESQFTKFGFDVIHVAEGTSNWANDFARAIHDLSLVPGRQRVAIATIATFSSPKFQQALLGLNSELLFVADEVHNFGSSTVAPLLPKKARMRLGLSATPRRWNDDWGTIAISDYFGPVIFNFTIKDAIAAGALTEYLYFPRLTEMTSLESETYAEMTIRLAGILRGRSFQELDKVSAQKAGAILTSRAALLGAVTSKWRNLEADLTLNKGQAGQLVYTGVGSSPLTPSSREIEITEDLMKKMALTSLARYESLTDRATRRRLLEEFRQGRLEYLLSMKCLDEGVDIPNAKFAYFVASSANPRQFIQRRGRVLRKAENKDNAQIYDYFMLPRAMSLTGISLTLDRKIGARELARTLDFIDACSNKAEALESIRPLIEMYGDERE